MESTNAKWYFGGFVIACVSLLQIVAWAGGHDGQVFALTSAAIGGIAGALLGIDFGKSKK